MTCCTCRRVVKVACHFERIIAKRKWARRRRKVVKRELVMADSGTLVRGREKRQREKTTYPLSHELRILESRASGSLEWIGGQQWRALRIFSRPLFHARIWFFARNYTRTRERERKETPRDKNECLLERQFSNAVASAAHNGEPREKRGWVSGVRKENKWTRRAPKTQFRFRESEWESE